MKQRFKRQNKFGKSYKKKIVFFLLSIFLLAGLYFIFGSGFLAVKKINVEVNGDRRCSDEEQIKNIISKNNPNFFFINQNKIEKEIKEKFICIDSVNFKKSFPEKLNVLITERKPAAVINLLVLSRKIENLDLETASASSEEAKMVFNYENATISGKFLADKDGFIFGEGGNLEGVLQIDFVNYSTGLGKKISGDVVNVVISIVEELKKLSIVVSDIKVEDEKIIILTKPKIVFSAKKDYKRQIASLQLILQKAKMKSYELSSEEREKLKSLDFIDLRFDKPVLIYSSNKK